MHSLALQRRGSPGRGSARLGTGGPIRPCGHIPTYDALFFGSNTDARYDLRSDSRQSLTKAFTVVKRFWDIESSDIQLMATHGSMLQDASRVAAVLQLPLPEFGMTRAAAEALAADIAEAASQGFFDGGDNPLFTLNAFAFTAEGDPDPAVAGPPDKLIFGDGILDALDAMGIGDVGARVVRGHEFGHHVQFEDGLFSLAADRRRSDTAYRADG